MKRLLLLFLLLPAVPVAASPPLMLPGAVYSMDIKSLSEQRWTRIIPQRYDFSCGSAAVATLLTYHYDRPTTEAEVFETMYRHGDQARIRAQGFSMLDLKRYLDSRGLNAAGFRMSLAELERIGVPAIVLVSTNGYRHFIVIKGIRGDEVVAGDPAGGTVVITRDQLIAIWDGIVLAARAELELAREHFNHPGDWGVRPAAPLAQGRYQTPLTGASLSLPGHLEFGR
jgi:predicted double-glycine peptidase